jgi:hypothetical protein
MRVINEGLILSGRGLPVYYIIAEVLKVVAIGGVGNLIWLKKLSGNGLVAFNYQKDNT